MQLPVRNRNQGPMVLRTWLPIVSMMCISSGTPLLAQAPASVPPALRAGGLYVEPAFAVSTGPNSNINQEGGSVKVESYETVVIPHADVVWRHGANEVRGFLAYEFAMYANSKTPDGGPAKVPTGRNSFAEVGFSREAVFAPSVQYVHRNFGARADDFEEVAQKSRRVEDSLVAGLDLRASARVHLLAQSALEQTRYDADAVYADNPLADKLNFDRTIYSLGVGYQLTPLVSLATNISRFADQFVRASDRDNDGLTVNTILTLAPRALFTGNVGVGYKTFGAPDPGAESFSGLVVSASLEYMIRDSTLLTVRINRDTSYSFDAARSYYVANQIGTSVEQPLVHNLELFALFNHYKLNYKGALGGSDRQIGYGGGLRVRVRPWARVGFNIDHIERQGGLPWQATRLVGFVTYGSRFRKLERVMPGDTYVQ